jgi:hypothetical protein
MLNRTLAEGGGGVTARMERHRRSLLQVDSKMAAPYLYYAVVLQIHRLRHKYKYEYNKSKFNKSTTYYVLRLIS